MTITGTSYFVSRDKAERYYRDYHGDATAEIVAAQIADGSIHIGKPPLVVGDKLILLDAGTRYGIESGR